MASVGGSDFWPPQSTAASAPDARVLVGLLATPARLRIVAAVALGHQRAKDIAAVTGLSEAEVSTALTRLVRGGLVSSDRDGFSVDASVFAAAARAAAPLAPAVDFGVSDPAVAAVLHAFLKDGRLTAVPVNARKRRIVLEHLVVSFEPGRRYAEPEVNAILTAFFADYAALRRHLVDEGLLTRDRGVYWRTGGPPGVIE